MSSAGALAIFVKTPELSPVKTRLAASIGAPIANHFYELSLVATSALARQLQAKIPSVQPYWAIAESEALGARRWASFPNLAQGTGSLGARLSHVYQELLKKHHYVCFIGADSPHLPLEDLLRGTFLTARHLGEKFVIGDTSDGGFYFFGGSIPVPASDWQSVEYSTQQTANQLKARLSTYSGIECLIQNFDVDTVDDLRRLSKISETNSKLLPEQLELIRWANQIK